MPNFNLGLTLKPLPITSVYVAYATSSDPVGAEFDGTSANYGGLAPIVNGNSNQIFGPQKNTAIEVGNKWELFDRHLLVSGALFQTNVTNARESVNVTDSEPDAACPITVGGTQPASPPAQPIRSAASISKSPARSPTNGACSAAWC